MGVKATNKEGGFFSPANGVYVGVLTGVVEAGPWENSKFDDAKPRDTWYFMYGLLTYPDLEPVIDEDAKGQALVDPRLTQTLGKNSAARKHLRALLRREIQEGEDSDDLLKEAISKTILMEYGSKDGNDGRLLNTMPSPEMPGIDEAGKAVVASVLATAEAAS